MNDDPNNRQNDSEKRIAELQDTIRSLSRSIENLSDENKELRQELRQLQQQSAVPPDDSPPLSMLQSTILSLIVGIVTTLLTLNLLVGFAALGISIFVFVFLWFHYDNYETPMDDEKQITRLSKSRVQEKESDAQRAENERSQRLQDLSADESDNIPPDTDSQTTQNDDTSNTQ